MTADSPNDAQRTVNADEFQARCLALIDEVAETGEPITITRDGQPLLRLVPCTDDVPPRKGPPFPSPLGADRGLIKIAEGVDLDEISVFDDDWEEQWEQKWDERLR
ncbi:MAG: type II toxin-antitoxin system Phd/YefM family antitoxin [Chloroflexota bacterium]|nr:type II toxin-antitoxin system Phd/YefM family antitoxin [Chloroflexota bacterium]MDE2894338.1 type II toxin-antitoxin system Phd/YefM family antitoxin [Chloroflexota bacterium]